MACCQPNQHTRDAHSDVIHVRLPPVWVWPAWTAARDACLLRYWQCEEDTGSYVVCFQSIEHPACPPVPGCVRATVLAGGCTITAPKDPRRAPQTLITYMLQIDPGGWLQPGRVQRAWDAAACASVLHAYTSQLLMSILDTRQLLNRARFSLDKAPADEPGASAPTTTAFQKSAESFWAKLQAPLVQADEPGKKLSKKHGAASSPEQQQKEGAQKRRLVTTTATARGAGPMDGSSTNQKANKERK